MSSGQVPHLKYSSRRMKRIDLLGWTEGIAFTVYGARIGVRSNDAASLQELSAHFPAHWRRSKGAVVDWLYSLRVGKVSRKGVSPVHLLYSNVERLTQSDDYELLVKSFENDVEVKVALAARRKLFVHAGVVGWRGRAILIPGKTFTGKSTLVAELVRAGATYYSDEFAVLDGRGLVHPFARPLSLRDKDLRNQKIGMQALGGSVGNKPLPVGLILVTKYREHARWRPRSLSPGEGALELLANTLAAERNQRTLLATLARTTERAAILKGERGEAHAVAPSILERLD